MSEDFASLRIRIESIEAATAEKRLHGLERQGKRTERATDGLTRSFSRMIGPIAALVSVSAGLNKLYGTAKQVGVLKASLETATGSAENAAKAFGALEDFAEKTPYSLDQVVESFITLTNRGLTPSERALNSFGNTASALGKELDQMIGAVANATVGEFEMLKTFGIKAKNQGDTIKFTFRGVSEEVKNNASEIEEYLTRLGEKNFSTSMALQMKEIKGLSSNLGDQWDETFRIITERGAGDAIKGSLKIGIGALEELNAMLASGELEGYLDVFTSKFDGFGADAKESIRIISEYYEEFLSGADEGTKETIDSMTGFFSDMPENIRAFIQIMVVELAAFNDKSAIWGKEIADNLKFWDGDTFDFERAIAVVDAARLEGIDIILLERETAVSSSDAQIKKVKALRTEYDRLNESRAAKNEESGEDRLEEFAVEGDSEEDETFWDRYLESAQEALTSVDELALSTVENLSSGFGDAFESMIFDSENFGDAIDNLMVGMARSTVNALGKMAAEWVAYQLVQMALGKTSEAAAVAGSAVTGTSIAAAYAPAAAMVSLATMGGNAIPAAAAITSTTALSSSMAFAGAFDDGGMIPAGKFGIVREYGPETVHGPVNVTSRRTTEANMGVAANAPAAATTFAPKISITLNNNFLDAEQAEDYGQRMKAEIHNSVFEAVRDAGRELIA